MPLLKGKQATTPQGLQENIKREVAAGKSQKQAAAIAYSVKRAEQKKMRKKSNG